MYFKECGYQKVTVDLIVNCNVYFKPENINKNKYK